MKITCPADDAAQAGLCLSQPPVWLERLGNFRDAAAIDCGVSLMGSVGAIALAGSFLLLPDKTRRLLIPCLISYATGTLLGAAFLGLIPHALSQIPVSAALVTLLIGIVLFFILEKLVVWRHCQDQQCEVHGTAGPLLLIGDAFHNFADGVIIAATQVYLHPYPKALMLRNHAQERYSISWHESHSRRRSARWLLQNPPDDRCIWEFFRI